MLGTAADPRLPVGALDAVLIVDAYHEMEQPVALLRNAGARAQARRPASASSSSPAGRRAGAADGRARRSRSASSARRPTAGLRLIARRAIPALPIHAGVRQAKARRRRTARAGRDERGSGLLRRAIRAASTRSCSGSSCRPTAPRRSEAMAYTLYAPSKRVRPVLTHAVRRSCAAARRRARSAPPRRWSWCTPHRSSSTTSRRWTTRRCGAGGRPITWRSARRSRSSPRSGC